MQAHLLLFEANGGSWEWGSHRTWLLHISAWSTQIGQTHWQTRVLYSPNMGICGSPVNKKYIDKQMRRKYNLGRQDKTQKQIIYPFSWGKHQSFSIQMACERWCLS